MIDPSSQLLIDENKIIHSAKVITENYSDALELLNRVSNLRIIKKPENFFKSHLFFIISITNLTTNSSNNFTIIDLAGKNLVNDSDLQSIDSVKRHLI